MHELQGQQPEQRQQKGSPMMLGYHLLGGHAACFTVFTRRKFGIEAFRTHGPVGFAIIVVYGSLTGAWAMWPFLWCWLAMLLVRRIEAGWFWKKGMVEHSRYSGRPWLAYRLRLAKKETTAKCASEPLLCLVVGLCIVPFSEALGLFVMAGFLTLIMKAAMERDVLKLRVRALKDLEIEQKQLSAAFRGQNDDW